MRGLTPEQLVSERERTDKQLRSAILTDENIVGAFQVGSVADGTADEFSDLDYYLYVKGLPWARQKSSEWLTNAGLEVGLLDWRRAGKFQALVRITLLDLSINQRSQQEEIKHWPLLFFTDADIIKDQDGVLREIVATHENKEVFNPQNNYDGYVIGLFDLARQLIEGDYLGQERALSVLLDRKARMLQNLPIGRAIYRATRHIEKNLAPEQLSELNRLAFPQSEDQFRVTIVSELQAICQNTTLSAASRHITQELVAKLSVI